MELLVKQWIENNWLEDFMLEEIESSTPSELREKFSEALDFGTGGLRGVIGPGSNRINRLTIARAAAGFADYLIRNSHTGNTNIIVIAYDNRKLSKEFAMTSAGVLSAKGFIVRVFESITATPILSYSIRYFEAVGGIMITASHNPKEFNGFKIFDESGCQLLPDEAKKVKEMIDAYNDSFKIDMSDKQVFLIDDSIEDIYLEEFKMDVGQGNKEIKIGYSPQHGAGGRIMKKAFDYYGFSNVEYVIEQYSEDPNFTNTLSPNPENLESFDVLLKYGKRESLDLLLTTDPDADRIGVYCLHEGQYERLTGNQIGAIICKYLIDKLDETELEGKFIVKTIVSSSLGEQVAKKRGVQVKDVLTGFKYIGNEINKNGAQNFLFGYEESFGFLYKPITRDKDGIQIGLLISEISNYLKKDNMTLISYLNQLQEEHGYYMEETISMPVNEGISSFEIVHSTLCDYLKLISVKYEDFEKGLVFNLIDESSEPLKLPKENVQKYYLYDNSWIAIRPSGTESKIKIYFGTNDNNKKIAKKKFSRLKKEIANCIILTEKIRE